MLTGGDNGKTEDFDVAREDGTLVMTYNGEKVLTLHGLSGSSSTVERTPVTREAKKPEISP